MAWTWCSLNVAAKEGKVPFKEVLQQLMLVTKK
jgi:hypothetical protein